MKRALSILTVICLAIFIFGTAKAVTPAADLKRLKLRLTGLQPNASEYSEINALSSEQEIKTYLEKMALSYINSKYFAASIARYFFDQSRTYTNGPLEKLGYSPGFLSSRASFHTAIYEQIKANPKFNHIYGRDIVNPIIGLGKILGDFGKNDLNLMANLNEQLTEYEPTKSQIFKQYMGLEVFDQRLQENVLSQINSELKSIGQEKIEANQLVKGLGLILKSGNKSLYLKLSKEVKRIRNVINLRFDREGRGQYVEATQLSLFQGGVLNRWLENDRRNVDILYSYLKLKLSDDKNKEKIEELTTYQDKMISSLVKFTHRQKTKTTNVLSGTYFQSNKFNNTFNQTIYSESAALYRDLLCDNMTIQTDPKDNLQENLENTLRFSSAVMEKNTVVNPTKKFSQHTKAECSGCHKKLDPVQALFDGKSDGKVRIPFFNNLDAMSFIDFLPGDNLAHKLMKTKAYKRCQNSKLWSWLVGNNVPMPNDVQTTLTEVFEKSQGDIRELALEIVKSKEFYRGNDLEKNLVFSDVRPVFQRCFNCHQEREVMVTNLSKYPFEDWMGNSTENVLEHVIAETDFSNLGENKKMPLGYSLSSADFHLLASWLMQGAKDDRGRAHIRSNSPIVQSAKKAKQKLEMDKHKVGLGFDRLLDYWQFGYAFSQMSNSEVVIDKANPYYKSEPYGWRFITQGQICASNRRVQARGIYNMLRVVEEGTHSVRNQDLSNSFYGNLSACFRENSSLTSDFINKFRGSLEHYYNMEFSNYSTFTNLLENASPSEHVDFVNLLIDLLIGEAVVSSRVKATYSSKIVSNYLELRDVEKQLETSNGILSFYLTKVTELPEFMRY